MTSHIPVLSIDFETASCADLRKVGAHDYARHPTTRVLCMAWAFDDDPVTVWVPGMPFPRAIIDHVETSPHHTVRGWNVGFEYEVWNHVLTRIGTHIPMLWRAQLDDTMARAAYWGLPLSLDQAGQAAQLPFQKDKAGHALMLRMCRPRGIDPLTGQPTWWHEEDPVKYDQLQDYCARDVEVERALAKKLPPLPDREKQLWRMDSAINSRGVPVDRALAKTMKDLAAKSKIQLDQKIHFKTKGVITSTGQTARILQFAKDLGYTGTDLRKDTLKEQIPKTTGDLRDVLLLRREASRTSTAKLTTLLNASEYDGKIHGSLQYYGANRTGRWAGRLFQPQNIPRPTIKNVKGAIDAIRAGADVEDLDLLFEDTPLGVIASCLRGCIRAEQGRVLVSADLSQIEARVIAWLAGQQDVLDIFASGADIYTHDANAVGSKDRQLGKVQRLGLGFGMGPDKFMATAKGYGLSLSPEFAQEVVYGWRANNPRIVRFWWDCDDAIRRIATGAKGPIHVGLGVKFERKGSTMLVTLPSDRQLVYRGIRLDPVEGVSYLGVSQYTKQWGLIRTYGGKIAENLTQAVARDVMADALLDIHDAGYQLILTVHDEAIAHVPAAEGHRTLKFMLDTMTMPRSWTQGLPVAAEGWVGERYRK